MKLKSIELLTIGELAKSADVHIETVRFYQRRGLLIEPEKPPGGIRRYGAVDSARIQFIKTAQNLGFSLDEVMTLLTLEDGTQSNIASKIAEQKLIEVRQKLTNLKQLEKILTKLVAECEKSQGQIYCPLIESLQSQ